MTVPPQARQAAYRVSRPKYLLSRLAPFLLVAVGVALLAGAFAGWQAARHDEPAGYAELPPRLAELSLASAIYGPEAVADVARLHGKDFPLTSGALGVYGDGQANATLWVTGTGSQFSAARMVRAMRNRIAEGNSPFLPIEERKGNGRTIYVLEGMSQRHYYFRAKDTVIWLAADGSIAEQALKDVLRYYP